MTQINQELERQRKREKHHVEDLIKTTNSAREKADYKQLLTELNQSKYPLLKNKENLNEKQL
jgi:hypothetical protein